MAVGFLAVLVFLPFSPIFSVLSLSAVTYGFFTFRASNKQYGLVKSVKDQIEESMRESALADDLVHPTNFYNPLRASNPPKT